MQARQSTAFIEQALVKVFSRGDRTVLSVAEELNVRYHTLKYWMKCAPAGKRKGSNMTEKRPQDWCVEDQLVALHETHGLNGEELNAWCREHGLFAHHLDEWKAAFCSKDKASASIPRDLRTLKDENEELKREVLRKDKALAEAAALLILQKKFRALWEDEGK